jgi:hypothetical protein
MQNIWINEALRTWTYLDRVLENKGPTWAVRVHQRKVPGQISSWSIMCNHIEHVMIYHDLSNCLYCVQLFQTLLDDRRTGSTGSKRSERISSHRGAALAVWPPTKKHKEGVCPNALLFFFEVEVFLSQPKFTSKFSIVFTLISFISHIFSRNFTELCLSSLPELRWEYPHGNVLELLRLCRGAAPVKGNDFSVARKAAERLLETS